MQSGYFLGVSYNVGDSFLYVVLPLFELDKYEKRPRYKPQTLVRSVIRKRDPTDADPPPCAAN